MLDLLDTIKFSLLNSRLKGYLHNVLAYAVRDIGVRGWNVLRGDLPFPIAVLKQTALEHNFR